MKLPHFHRPHLHWSYLYGDIARTILTAVAVLALLVLLINQQNHNSKQLATTEQILATQKQELIAQGKVIDQINQAVTDLKNNDDAKLTDLQNHIDCLFKIATTPHTTVNPPRVTDIASCNPQTMSNGNASGAGTTSRPSASAPTKNPQPSNSNNSGNSNAGGNGNGNGPSPSPAHPLICKITFKLIGC